MDCKIKPAITEAAVVTIPGSIKLWFKTYLPILVVPVRSNWMAVSRVGYSGMKKCPFTAGKIPTMNAGVSPSDSPSGSS